MPELIAPQKPKKTRRHKAFAALIGVLLVIMTVVLGVYYGLQSREISVPGWLRARIEQRVAEAMPDMSIGFGDMIFVVDEGWRPRALVRDVQVRGPEDQEIIAVSEIRASLAMRPLLRQQVALKSLDVQGVFLTLRRLADGRVTMSSLGAGNFGESTGLAQLLSGFSQELNKPALQALTVANVRALTLRYEDLQAGRAWTIDGGRLRLVRDAEDIRLSADLALLGGGAGAATLEANYTGKIGEMGSEFGFNIADIEARDIATQGPAFTWLNSLDATISGALRGGVDQDGALAPLNATLQISQGVISPNPEAKPIPINGARSYFSYLPQEGLLRFDELSVDSKWITGRLEGQTYLEITQNGTAQSMVGQFKVLDLRLNPNDLYDEPVAINGAEMDVRLGFDPLELTIGRVQIVDQGSVLSGSAGVAARPFGWEINVDAGVDQIARDRLLELWPQGAGAKLRRWLDSKLSGGTLQNLELAYRARQGNQTAPYLSFDFQDASAAILPGFPPLTGARGHASLLRDRFVLSLDRGFVKAPKGGWVSLKGSSYIVPDVRLKDNPPALVRLSGSGSITAALSLLDLPPKAFVTEAGLPVALAGGTVALEGVIAFPLQKKPPKGSIKYDLAGTLNGVSSAVLVPGRTLAAQRLDIAVSNRQINITGRGTLDGLPFGATFNQPLADGEKTAGRVRGNFELSERALAALGIAVPPGTMAGGARADFDLQLPRGTAPKIALSTDLAGLSLDIPALGWRKPAGDAGRLRLSATLDGTPQVDAFSIAATGLEAAGSLTIGAGNVLDLAVFERLKVANWLDVAARITGGNVPSVSVIGGRFDLRAAPTGGDGGSGGPLSVALDRLQITDSIAIDNFSGDFNTAGGIDGNFTGKLNGRANVQGRVIPQGARSAVRITSRDAGAVLAAAGVLKKARGGSLDLSLLPLKGTSGFTGQLKITQINLLDAPVIAALLNAVSIVGLLDELGGNGIAFSEVLVDFILDQGQLTITAASAVGPSIGLSMEGVYDWNTQEIAMQGVLSPVYLINGIGSALTRAGEGVIGFNYEIMGPAAAPVVTVNPLSVLAPSFLREIFRKPAPSKP